MRAAFMFDPNRCTGCRACELGCSIENDLGPERSWREVVTFNEISVPGVPRFHLSLACNHCVEPACMHSCPALAYSRDASGAVLLDAGRCIGCRYCTWACPYGAPQYEKALGVVGKCTFCSHRLERGLKPACATLCPTGALEFATLPASALSADVPGFPQTRLGPSIRIETPHRSVYLKAAPLPGDPRSSERRLVGAEEYQPGIGLNTEWSLAAFTFLLALLFATFEGARSGRLPVHPLAFGAGAAAALVVSLSHLGRPERAWRAGLNLGRSWLSREVVGFSLFAGLGTVSLALPAPVSGLAPAATIAGLLTLLSADMVYRPVYTGLHPALDTGGSLFTGIYLAGLVLGNPWIAGTGLLVKGGGEARRSIRRPRDPNHRAAVPTAARIILGLVIPAAAWIGWGTPLSAWVIGAAIAGEAVARTGFYGRLNMPRPGAQARADLVSRLSSPAA